MDGDEEHEAASAEVIPDEQWISIFSLLSAREVLKVSFVDRRFKRLALQVPVVNNTLDFYKDLDPLYDPFTTPYSLAPQNNGQLVLDQWKVPVDVSAILRFLPGVVKNALVLRLDSTVGHSNYFTHCLGLMKKEGELPGRLRVLEWRGVIARELQDLAPILQGNLKDIQLQFLFQGSRLSILGGFLAAAAKACPDLETLRLSLQLTVQRQEDFDEDMSESDDDDAPLYFADSDAWGRDYTDYEDEMDSDTDLHFGSMRPPGVGGVMKCKVDEEMDEGEHDVLDDSDFPPSDETYGSDDNWETLPGEGGDDGGRGRAANERSWFDGGGGNAFGELGVPSPGLVERLFGNSNDMLGFPVDSPDLAQGEAEASEKGVSHSEEEGGEVARIPGAIDAGVALPGRRSTRNGNRGRSGATKAAKRGKGLARGRTRTRRASKKESSSDKSEDGDSDESAPGDEAAAAGVNGSGALRGLGASNRQSGAEKEKELENGGGASGDPFIGDLSGAGLSTGEAAQPGRPIGDAAGGIGDRQVGNPLWEKAQEEKYYADIERNRGRIAAIDARRLNFWERRSDGRKAALKALAMPLVKDFSVAVKKVLEGCRSLRVLELPCGKFAHFRTRHENLQSLTLDGMAEIAYSTDTINELTKYLPALRHLSLSCATLPWNDIQMILGDLGNVHSRACVSSTLETLELSRFIYPGSFSLDMPRLKQLFLLNPYKIGPRPYHGQDTDSEEAEAQENMLHSAAGDRPQTYDLRDMQLNCPALKELRLGFPISNVTLSEASTTCPALRTLFLEVLSEPSFLLSGGFPALVSARLGLKRSAASSLAIDHPAVQSIIATIGKYDNHLKSKKQLSIHCLKLERLEVRGPRQPMFPPGMPEKASPGSFSSEIWAPSLKFGELPGRAPALPTALRVCEDVEELKIFVKTGQDMKALSALRKLKKLEIICEKGCTAIVLKSESLVDLELIVASSDLRKVHLSAPLLTKLDLLNRSAPRLRVDDLQLALGQITSLDIPFGVKSLAFGAGCPRLERLHVLAYHGKTVEIDSSNLPAVKTLHLELPKAKLRSVSIRSDTLECFKMHAMRTLRNPDVCTVRCPQLKELHLHVLPPSLAAIGVGCPNLETLVVAGGMHLGPGASIDPGLVEKLAAQLTDQGVVEQVQQLTALLPNIPDARIEDCLQDDAMLRNAFDAALHLVDPAAAMPESDRRQLFLAVKTALPKLLPVIKNPKESAAAEPAAVGGQEALEVPKPADPSAGEETDGKAKASSEPGPSGVEVQEGLGVREEAQGGSGEGDEKVGNRASSGGKRSAVSPAGLRQVVKRPRFGFPSPREIQMMARLQRAEASLDDTSDRVKAESREEETLEQTLERLTGEPPAGGSEFGGFDPLGLGRSKGKRKVSEGGRKGGKGKRKGDKKKAKKEAVRPVARAFSLELGAEFPNLKEVHFQVWSGALPSNEFQRHFKLSTGRHWCFCPSSFSGTPTMSWPWNKRCPNSIGEPLMHQVWGMGYDAPAEHTDEDNSPSSSSDPEASDEEILPNPFASCMPSLQKMVSALSGSVGGSGAFGATSSAPVNSQQSTRAMANKDNKPSTSGETRVAGEEPFESRLKDRGSSIRNFARSASVVPGLALTPHGLGLTSGPPTISVKVTCPELREAQIFADLQLESATVNSAKLKGLRVWIAAEGSKVGGGGVGLACPRMERMDWQVARGD